MSKHSTITNAHTLHAFCIPVLRIAEAADAARQYDKNFSRFGHTVPILLFSDASPHVKNEDGSPRFPNYPRDYELLCQAARQCAGDVYIVTPEDKRDFLRWLTPTFLQLRPELQIGDAEQILDEVFFSPWGGNYNWILLYTYGTNIITCDDDVRPYQLTLDHPITPKDERIMWVGLEHATNSSGYDELIGVARGGSLSSGLSVSAPDVLNYLFSPIGKSWDELTQELSLELLRRAHSMRYSDRFLYTATTLDNYPMLPGMVDPAKYRMDIDGLLSSALPAGDPSAVPGPGVKPFPYYIRCIGSPVKQSGRVQFVVPVVDVGIPDYDAMDFLKFFLSHPEADTRYDIRAVLATAYTDLKLTVLDVHYAMSAQMVALANDHNVGPFFLAFRQGDLGYRLDSLADGVLTAVVPINQTHVQSRAGRGSSLGEVTYLETLGEYSKPVLLNGRQPDGSYQIDMKQFTFAIATSIVDEMRHAYDQCLQHLNEGVGSSDRRETLERIAVDLERRFESFDGRMFHERASQEMEKQIQSYLTAKRIWPDLQKLVAKHRDRLLLTHVASGKRASMQELMDDSRYSRTFQYPSI